MIKITNLVLVSASLIGCSTLGFIDHERFMASLNENRCAEAYQMVAVSNFHNKAARWTYMGQVEYFCKKNRSEGVRLLTKGAQYGDSWASLTLARIGEKIPDVTSLGVSAGAPSNRVDLNITFD